MHADSHDGRTRFGLRELVAYATLLVLLNCGLACCHAIFRWHTNGWQPSIVLTVAATGVIACCQLLAVLRKSYLLSRLLAAVFTTIGAIGLASALFVGLLEALGVGGYDGKFPPALGFFIGFCLIGSWLFSGITMKLHAGRCTRAL